MAWKKVISTSNNSQTLIPNDLQTAFINDPNDTATAGMYGGFCTGGASTGNEGYSDCIALGGGAKWIDGKVLKVWDDGGTKKTRWEKDYRYATYNWNGTDIVDFDPHNSTQDSNLNTDLDGNESLTDSIDYNGSGGQVLRTFSLNLSTDPFGHPIFWNVSHTYNSMTMTDIGFTESASPTADLFVHADNGTVGGDDGMVSLTDGMQGFNDTALAANEHIDGLTWTLNTNTGGAGQSSGGSVITGSTTPIITKQAMHMEYLADASGNLYTSGTCSGTDTGAAYDAELSADYNNSTGEIVAGLLGDPVACKADNGTWSILPNADRYDKWRLRITNFENGSETDSNIYEIGHRLAGDYTSGDSAGFWADTVSFESGTSPGNGSSYVLGPDSPQQQGNYIVRFQMDLGSADRVNSATAGAGIQLGGNNAGDDNYSLTTGYFGLELDYSGTMWQNYISEGSISGLVHIGGVGNFVDLDTSSTNSSGDVTGHHSHDIESEWDHSLPANYGKLIRSATTAVDGGAGGVDGGIKLVSMEVTGDLLSFGPQAQELTGETQITDNAVAINNVLDVDGEVESWADANSSWTLGNANVGHGVFLINNSIAGLANGNGAALDTKFELRHVGAGNSPKDLLVGDLKVWEGATAMSGTTDGDIYCSTDNADKALYSTSSWNTPILSVNSDIKIGTYTPTSQTDLTGLPAAHGTDDSRMCVADFTGDGGNRELMFVTGLGNP